MFLNRFLRLALLLLIVAVSCHAEGECVADSGEECANPEATEAGSAEAVADASETTTEEVVEEASATQEEDPQCPSRPFIIRCAGEYLDTNKNGKLERAELQAAIDKLPWYSRGILKIIGSVDKMMTKCDMDGDDAISMDYDMEKNKEQCLASCFKRRAFKGSFFPDCE